LSALKTELTKGTAFCIPAHKGHRYYASEKNPWSILWVHFKGENSVLYPINEKNLIQIETPEDNNRLQTFFIQLFEILGFNYTQGNFICASNLLSVILGEIYFREKKSSVDKQNQQLTKAIQFMYNRINSTLTLADITDYMQLSKSYLSNLFKKYTHHSPVDFFIRLKIQQACKYLRLTDSRVCEVANDVGYEDQFYFSRIFKKVTGISPREYQNGMSIRNDTLKIDNPE
jgi:AraC-like DNA-binding protein